MVQKQLAFMLGRQQIFLELDEDTDEYEELMEIMSNSHLNNNFLALAREVCTAITHSYNLIELSHCLTPLSSSLVGYYGA